MQPSHNRLTHLSLLTAQPTSAMVVSPNLPSIPVQDGDSPTQISSTYDLGPNNLSWHKRGLWNASSIVNMITFSALQVTSKSLDIICITETWVTPLITDPEICPDNQNPLGMGAMPRQLTAHSYRLQIWFFSGTQKGNQNPSDFLSRHPHASEKKKHEKMAEDNVNMQCQRLWLYQRYKKLLLTKHCSS